jgi:hypothetical protein
VMLFPPKAWKAKDTKSDWSNFIKPSHVVPTMSI